MLNVPPGMLGSVTGAGVVQYCACSVAQAAIATAQVIASFFIGRFIWLVGQSHHGIAGLQTYSPKPLSGIATTLTPLR